MSTKAIRILGLAVPVVISALFAAPAAAGAATATDLRCSECVGNGEIRRDAIKSGRIKDGQVKPKDLHRKARPTGLNFALTFGSRGVSTDYESVKAVPLQVPVPGYALVNASWYVSGDGSAKCSCKLADEADNVGPASLAMASGQSPFREAAALTYVFPVEAGKTTFHLKCAGSGTDTSVYNISMNALFVPNRYEPTD